MKYGDLYDDFDEHPEHIEKILWFIFNNYRLEFEGFLRDPQLIKRRNSKIEGYLSDLAEGFE